MAGGLYTPTRLKVMQVPWETYTGIPMREAPEPLSALVPSVVKPPGGAFVRWTTCTASSPVRPTAMAAPPDAHPPRE